MKKKVIILSDKTKRFIKFGFVGGIGVGVDFGIFSGLTYVLREKIDTLVLSIIAPCIAFEIAVINNFLFSYFWVWKDRKGRLLVTLIKYNLSTALAFLIRMLLYHGSRYIFDINEKTHYLLNLAIYGIALTLGMLINFLLMEFKVFKKIEK
jgi:putative flippase GtrA